MKRILQCAAATIILAIAALAQNQPVTGNITTATAGAGNCVSVRAQNNSSVGIIVSGTWTGTLTPNVQISTASSAPTIAKKVVPVDSSTAQATIAANGGFIANIGGFTTFNVCATAWTSGTATVTLFSTPAPNNSTIAAAGGSGTVTNTGGALTANAVVLGAGGSDTKVSTGINTNGASELDVGVSGTNGVIGFNGSTSGKATLTAPAVAGTVANPVINSNAIQLPVTSSCTNPSIAFTGATNFGYATNASGTSGDVYVCVNGIANAAVGGPGSGHGLYVSNNIGIGFSSSNTQAAGPDTQWTRSSSGVMSSDTGTNGNGLASTTNCRTVVNVTPVTVNANVTTDQNLMAFTLPANCLNTVGRTLRIFVAGVYSTAAASTAQMTLEVKICSVSGCASGNVADVIDITSTALGSVTVANNAWNGTFYVTTQTGSTAGAWESHGIFGIDEGALTSAPDSFFNDTNTATVTGTPSAIDTTAQNFLQITFAFSAASGSNSVTQRQLVIDSVN